MADGVRVGIVRDIYYDYNQAENVVVEVELDTELRIPKRKFCRVDIRTDGRGKNGHSTG